MAELAKFVERTRGLRYKHAVDVEFLAEAAYRKAVGAEGDGELTKQDREEIETFSGQARALGLLPKGTDLLDTTDAIVDEGTLAFYDPDKQRMVVRGTNITIGVRTTVVHELTHALQDQQFDISRSFDKDATDEIFKALVEGDAVRVENLYVRSLSESDQEKYFAEQQDVEESVDLSRLPPAIVQLFGAPYALGAPMTAVVVQQLGQDALDRLFRHPPSSDEPLINPFGFIDRQDHPHVATPKLKAGEKRTDDGSFGTVTWFVMLASFIDARVALAAVDGWAGDSYVGYRKQGRTCLRVHFRGDSAGDDDEMSAALTTWSKAFPSGGPRIERLTAGVELDACEPDTTPTPRADADTALALPASRLEIVAEVLAGGAPVSAARCFATQFVKLVDIAALSTGTDADQAALQRLGGRIAAQCRR